MIHRGNCNEEDIALLKDMYELHKQRLRERFGTNEGVEIMYTNMLVDLKNPESTLFDSAMREKVSKFLHRLQEVVYGEQRRILSFGFIQAGYGNQAQTWHSDYRGKTENICIPLIPFNDLNGTEYVHFDEFESFEYWFWYIYSKHDEAVELPANLFPEDDPRHNIPNSPSKKYSIRHWHAEPYDICRMPYYLFHRGPTNRSKELKLMFYAATTDDPDFNLETHEIAPIITGEEDKGKDQVPGTEEYETRKKILEQKYQVSKGAPGMKSSLMKLAIPIGVALLLALFVRF